MHSGMIGKVAKAHRYVKERERFEVERLGVTIHGDNADHHSDGEVSAQSAHSSVQEGEEV